MKYRIDKISEIREDDVEECPFGLDISCGCKNAGELIDKMAPLDILGDQPEDEEILQLKKANNFLFRWNHPGKKCKYAAKLFDDKPDVVQCSWNTSTSGLENNGALLGSPYYYKHFSGIGTDGLYSYPLGYYSDNSIDRGMYYGMYSLESIATKENK